MPTCSEQYLEWDWLDRRNVFTATHTREGKRSCVVWGGPRHGYEPSQLENFRAEPSQDTARLGSARKKEAQACGMGEKIKIFAKKNLKNTKLTKL